jgi:hypothetical protein
VTEEEQSRVGYDGASLIAEIGLLVELVVEYAAPWLEGVVTAGHGPEQHAGAPVAQPDSEQPAAEPSGNCGWCPLCAIVAMVRGERPEFADRLLEQAAQLIALLRAVLADRWQPQDGVHMPGFQPASRQPAGQDVPVAAAAPSSTARSSSPSGRVQHIAVRKRTEWRPDREN